MLQYLELLVIALLLLLLFKPDYVKKLAGSLGHAVAEFQRQKEGEIKATDKELVWIAETLGIDVRGKTNAQLKKEIIEKLSST